MNPLKELRTLISVFIKIYQLKPAMILGFTIKPNVYVSLICRFLRIPIINTITGLGVTFIKGNFKMALAKLLYRISLPKSEKIFFENKDDQQLFLKSKLVTQNNIDLLPGSGVDLTNFYPCRDKANRTTGFVFLMICRILTYKGVYQYIEAARRVKAKYTDVKIQLLGPIIKNHEAAISRERLNRWIRKGDVDYLEEVSDVRPYIEAADSIVLPSFREGLPKTLLEAAAMAKPIIATNVPGCNEVVEDKVNGLLCKVKDVEDLVEKMIWMIEQPKEDRDAMGAASRRIAEIKFDEQIVIHKYIDAVENLISA